MQLGTYKKTAACKAPENIVRLFQVQVENPIETDPLIPHPIDPLSFSFSSINKVQADQKENPVSLHSI